MSSFPLRFFRVGAIYTLANVASAGVPFLLLPVLTRALPPSDYAQVISFTVLTAVCSAAAGLGLHSAVTVCWLKDSGAESRYNYTGSAIVVAVLSTVLTAGLAAMAGEAVDLGLSPAFCALAAIVAGTTVVQGIRFTVWQCTHRPVHAASLQVASAVLNICLSLFAVFALDWGGIGRIAGASVAALSVATFSVYSLVLDGAATRPAASHVKSLLRFGVPLIPHALGGAFLASADRFAVSSILGSTALGVYGSAFQLGMVINVLGDAVMKTYSPTLFRMLTVGSARARLRVVASAYLSIPVWLSIALLLWCVYRVAGPFILGPDYGAAIDLSIWFLVGGALSAVYLTFAGLFFFTNKTEWISVATVITGAFAMTTAYPLVRLLGVDGGGLTYLLSQAMLLTMVWLLSQRMSPMPWAYPLTALKQLSRMRYW